MAMAGTIANRQANAVSTKKKGKSVADLIRSMETEIRNALPAACGLTSERFVRIMLSAVSSNPKLASCTQNSLMAAMMSAAQAGIEPNTITGEAYLIPYNNHGTTECQFQIGYKGLLALAYRGAVTTVQAHEVYENDEFTFEYGLNPTIIHKPAMVDRGKVIAYYAIWKGENNSYGFEVMSREDMEMHKKRYSKASSNASPWNTSFDAMAKKTVIKKALKYAPISTELRQVLANDETIKHYTKDADLEYTPDETIYDDTEETETDEVVSELDPDQVTIVES